MSTPFTPDESRLYLDRKVEVLWTEVYGTKREIGA